MSDRSSDRTHWPAVAAAVGLLGAAVAVRDNAWFALALGGLGLAILLLSAYRRKRNALPSAPSQTGGAAMIAAGGDITVDLTRVDIRNFPQVVEAGGSVTLSAKDSEIAGVPHVGRNAPCPCGSGKKYKNCHGKQSK